MKGAILPVSAKPSSLRSLPARTGLPGLLWPICWAEGLGVLGHTVPTSRENPWAAAQSRSGTCPLHSGGRIYKHSEPFEFLSLSSLPPIALPTLRGCSSYLTLSKHPLFGGGGRHLSVAVTSSSWASSSLPSMALEARASHATYRLLSAKQRLQGWADAATFRFKFFPHLLSQGAGLLAKLLTGS